MTDIMLLVFGIAILTGFLGNLLFRKTKIPEALVLIGTGMLLGPVFHVVDQAALAGAAGLIISLMLIVTMLDNGLSFDLFRVARALPATAAFSLGVMALTVAALTLVLHVVFSFPLIVSALIGLALSGTTSDVITALVARMSVPQKTKQLLVFESVVNDLQIIPFFILLHFAETSTLAPSTAVVAMLQLPFAVLAGGAVALWWVHIIGMYLGKHPLNYAATIGLLFVLYNALQFVGGNGAVAVLTFSLVLGNARRLFRRFHPRSPLAKFTPAVLREVRAIEADVSFFVRALFFVFLGVVFNFAVVNSRNLAIAAALLAAIFACRYASGYALLRRAPRFKPLAPLVWIAPRGYIAMVLAFAAAGSDYGNGIVGIVLLNIFLTTFIAIVYSVYHERTAKQ